MFKRSKLYDIIDKLMAQLEKERAEHRVEVRALMQSLGAPVPLTTPHPKVVLPEPKGRMLYDPDGYNPVFVPTNEAAEA